MDGKKLSITKLCSDILKNIGTYRFDTLINKLCNESGFKEISLNRYEIPIELKGWIIYRINQEIEGINKHIGSNKEESGLTPVELIPYKEDVMVLKFPISKTWFNQLDKYIEIFEKFNYEKIASDLYDKLGGTIDFDHNDTMSFIITQELDSNTCEYGDILCIHIYMKLLNLNKMI